MYCFFEMTWSSHWSVSESRCFPDTAPERLGWVTKRHLTKQGETYRYGVFPTHENSWSYWLERIFFLKVAWPPTSGQVSVWKQNPTTTWGPRTSCRGHVITQIPTNDRTRWIWNSIHQPARQRKHTKHHPKHKCSMNFAHWTPWRWDRKVGDMLTPGNTMVAFIRPENCQDEAPYIHLKQEPL